MMSGGDFLGAKARACRIVATSVGVAALCLLSACSVAPHASHVPHAPQSPKPSKQISVNVKYYKHKATNILSSGTYYFDRRSNYLPDSQRIIDFSDLMNQNGIFPCLRDAQDTIPLDYNQPNGEFWWCQATPMGLKKLAQIPYPQGLPPRGQSPWLITRDGQRLLFMVSDPREEAANLPWILAYFDGQSTRTILSNHSFPQEPIKTDSQPDSLGLCGGKAYWSTRDLPIQEESSNNSTLYSVSLEDSAKPQVEIEGFNTFTMNRDCDIAVYYRENVSGQKKSPPRVDIYRKGNIIHTFTLDENITDPKIFASYLGYVHYTKDKRPELVLRDIRKDTQQILRDFPCSQIDSLKEVGGYYISFSCVEDESRSTFLYDTWTRRYYVAADAMAEFAPVPPEHCEPQAECFLVSWVTRTDVIPVEQHRQNKHSEITQSYAYWTPPRS